MLSLLAVAAFTAPILRGEAAAPAVPKAEPAREIRTGVFPFYRFVDQYQTWQFTPLDQGGRLVQLEVIGSERDADIVRAIRTPGFFKPWGEPIRWDSLEQTQVEKSVWLNRWYFIPCFGRQYYLTHDPSYLRDAFAFIRKWRVENPPPTNVAEYVRTKARNWRDMQVAWRVQNLSWFYFLGREGFTTAEKQELFEAIQEHAHVLLEDFGQQPLNENNHQSHGATTMLYAAILFPEMRDAAALREKGFAILQHHIEGAFTDDGNSVELCPGYYPFFVSVFRDAFLLCQANHIAPPKGLEARLRQFQQYLAIVVQPDGTMPPINDSTESDGIFPREIIDQVLGQSIAPKTPASHWFQSSHQAVARDSAPATPAYVFLDAGPRVAAHWHAGKLGFQLWYWDRPLLVDSGISNYDDPLKRSWYWLAPAHNTVLVDGAGDYDRNKIVAAKQPDGGSRMVRWESNADFDWAVMTHAGFQNRSGPVAWTRHFILLKGIGCVVIDRLQSTSEHAYTWLFHLPPCAPKGIPASSAVFTGFADRNLLLQPAAGSRLQLELAPGTVNRRGKNEAAPVAHYTSRAADTLQSFLLLPEKSATSPAVSFSQDARVDGATLRLETAGRVTRLSLTWEGKAPAEHYALHVENVAAPN